MTMQLSLNQCRQIHQQTGDIRDMLDRLNDQPEWMPEPITDLATIHAIQQGGCASGAYMPAVRYATAQQVMAEHGDAICDELEAAFGQVPPITGDYSWAGYCCLLVSYAVELWAGCFDLDGIDWD